MTWRQRRAQLACEIGGVLFGTALLAASIAAWTDSWEATAGSALLGGAIVGLVAVRAVRVHVSTDDNAVRVVNASRELAVRWPDVRRFELQDDGPLRAYLTTTSGERVALEALEGRYFQHTARQRRWAREAVCELERERQRKLREHG
jgi:hypothetical protein